MDVTLTTQATESVMDVCSQAPLLRPDSSALAEVINSRKVEALPINGRDYRRLTTLAPGSAPRSPRGSLGSFTVNGQRATGAWLIRLRGAQHNHWSAERGLR
ncbi:MAG TPA: hypothetical protein VLG74_04780 [Blastocatellia bacterium]|nr:hypothetical protein [Blastocatellia bacterium]